jgi:hypothetical protein
VLLDARVLLYSPADPLPAVPRRLWSTSEVEEKVAKYTVVPQLRLRGTGGRAVIAKDVLLFRIDNLEGQLIGQAIVAREWIKS